MQQIDNTTFTANGLGDVKPDIIIGGKDKTKFIPNINMSFFGDEFFINLNRRDKTAIASAVDGKAEIGGIDKDIFHIDDQGRFKWDIEFASRPAVNSWTWELKHTKGIEFYYQDALTAEEIAEGCERPDEVVGSYAVYCNKSNNKYKTGKVCHIYRPFCYDAKGNTIYADLKIADGQLTITIDAKWLDNAVYPVRLDPTFGYTTAGASSMAGENQAWKNILLTSAGSDGAFSKLYVYLSGTWARDIYLGYYHNNSRVEYQSITSGFSAGWNYISLSGEVLSGEGYEPSFVLSNGTGSVMYDSMTSAAQYGWPGGYAFMSTWTAAGTQNRIFSLYLEYTESGGTGNTYYYQQQQM